MLGVPAVFNRENRQFCYKMEHISGVPVLRWNACLAFYLLLAGVDVDRTVVVELESTAFTSTPACMQSASAERISESRKGDESHSCLATWRWEVCSSNLRYGRMRTVPCSGRLSCHECHPLPCTPPRHAHPLLNRITDTCESITLTQLRCGR